MKKPTLLFLLIMAIPVMISANNAMAQMPHMWKGSGGWGPGGHFQSLYDPNTVETISGEVTQISTVRPQKGMGQGVHLEVKTDKESISIHLGPNWFIENQDVKIELNDKVEIKGSRVRIARKPAIIASEIKMGDETMILRDENGYPVWSGWKKQK